MLNELAKEFDLTLWATINTEQGKAYQYMDPIGINIIFNEWDQSFELKWLIPKSIFTIECPTYSPYTNKEHFQKIYLKFWRTSEPGILICQKGTLGILIMEICNKCDNYICKAYCGTCRKYRILRALAFWRNRGK